jgi:hypothetical protein
MSVSWLLLLDTAYPSLDFIREPLDWFPRVALQECHVASSGYRQVSANECLDLIPRASPGVRGDIGYP